MPASETNICLPSEEIQRILYICPRVHIYQIPPLTTSKGYTAVSWTHDTNPTAKEIFLARLRIRETSCTSTIPSPISSASDTQDNEDNVQIEILLEDPSTGDLFAAAPYTSSDTVQAAIDSSRFFAITVVSVDAGSPRNKSVMKAILGLGFEDRADAIDFGICLQECAKTIGQSLGSSTFAGRCSVPLGRKTRFSKEAYKKQDWSLKEGEMVNINLGYRPNRTSASGQYKGQVQYHAKGSVVDGPRKPDNVVSIPLLAPPPSTQALRLKVDGNKGELAIEGSRERSKSEKSDADLGFDDGEFGEFQ